MTIGITVTIQMDGLSFKVYRLAILSAKIIKDGLSKLHVRLSKVQGFRVKEGLSCVFSAVKQHRKARNLALS